MNVRRFDACHLPRRLLVLEPVFLVNFRESGHYLMHTTARLRLYSLLAFLLHIHHRFNIFTDSIYRPSLIIPFHFIACSLKMPETTSCAT